ncbi:ABC transporter ATP-binding protein [Leisingera sp.]|uniref:ABC transporter ATP-binding protein n=1 Tax=Leisingera sp. TaxID=1879318 RepID=UPI002B276D9C|nr:ABC transporter ATP-binding protein [Leisingera sp.]
MTAQTENILEVDNLTVYFGEFAAVKNASFSVRRGETFGIVGESGSGKSTILKAISGLADIAGGRITMGGKELNGARPKASYQDVQLVFQDPYSSLHPRHTIDRALSEPAKIHRLSDVESRVSGLLNDVGLGSMFRYRYPNQLSGGQRQRIAIARSLVLEPSLILLDEPTSALDVSVQAEILNLLKRLKKTRGLSYILVSHDISVISHMCDRIAVMNNGEIVDQVTVEQLRNLEFSSEYSRQLVRSSIEYEQAITGSRETLVSNEYG